MTSKNPVRSCEDVDESVLSYAEIKALCIGDPRIKEKMDLDIQVAKLRVLEGSHKSRQYRLQDSIMKYYPREIEQTRKHITELEKDLKRWTEYSRRRGADDEFDMTVMDKTFGKDQRKEAGEAILEAAKGLHGIKNANKIGESNGFEMRLIYNFAMQKMNMSLKSPEADGMTHQVELGTSPAGNIIRIDNALEKISERLESEKAHIDDLHKQLEASKEELGRSFPQARELEEKSARLAELDILLNMDSQGKPPQEETAENISLENAGPEPGADGGSDRENRIGPFPRPDENVQPEKGKDPSPDAPVELQIGQKVAYRLKDNNLVVLSGYVLQADDATVKIQAGMQKLTLLRDKGDFEILPSEMTRKLPPQENITNSMGISA
jgi:hypothetical protein